MKTKIYKLKALTNMHVGSGDLSFGIIDKLVQRDPVSSFPVIHATSMKGSLKEFCTSNGFDTSLIENIFGKGDREGANKFFSAHLLTMPVRSNIKPYFRACCPEIIRQFKESLEVFGVSTTTQKNSLKKLLNIDFLDSSTKEQTEFILFQDNIAHLVIEEWSKIKFHENVVWDNNLKKWFGEKENFVLVRDDVFLEICENLPVVARNNLSDQRNLWYEELLPRQSEFWFFHLFPETDVISMIKEKNIPVQVGANASVGYGYCQITGSFEVKTENGQAESGEESSLETDTETQKSES